MSYTALVLEEADQKRLLQTYQTLEKPYAHHMTVMMGSRPEDLEKNAPFFKPEDLGKKFQLQILGVARSPEIEAVAVAVLGADGVPVMFGTSKNRTAHITIATDGKTKPVRSNDLLMGGYQSVGGDFDGEVVTATLRFVD